MPTKALHRKDIVEYASTNGFERACLKEEISSLGYGFIVIPAMKKLALEGDGVTAKAKKVLGSFAFPPSCVVFSSASLNPFVNQLIAHPSYVIEVDKEYLESTFEALRHGLSNRVILNPSEAERTLYYEPGLVCLYPLMSKAPVSKNGDIRVEKLLVDLLVSARYRSLYSGRDIENALRIICNEYAVNYRTLFAYASRKRKTQRVYDALEEAAEGSIKEVLHAIKEKL